MAGKEPTEGSRSSMQMDLNLNPLPRHPGRLGGAIDCPESAQLLEMPIAEVLRTDEPQGLLVPEETPLQPAMYSSSNALSTPELSLIEWLDGLTIDSGEGLDAGEPVATQSNVANASSPLTPPLLPSVSVEELTPEFRLQWAILVCEHHRILRPGPVTHYQRATNPEADRLVQTINGSHSSVGTSRGAIKNWNCGCNSSFQCNICLEAAKEPVVTPCGHLFCWPCLYQWLHGHSVHSECPVCKREVLEVNVTPIYGRLGDERDASNNDVPPRPHANTTGSLRQQLQTQGPRGIASANPILLHADNTTAPTLQQGSNAAPQGGIQVSISSSSANNVAVAITRQSSSMEQASTSSPVDVMVGQEAQSRRSRPSESTTTTRRTWRRRQQR